MPSWLNTAGRDDRQFLRDWYPQAAEYEHGQNAEVRKVVDELLECLHGVLAGRTMRRVLRPFISVADP